MKALTLGILLAAWAGAALAQEAELPLGVLVFDAAPSTQSQASIRSGEPVAVPAGTIPVGQIAPGIDLAPGETIVEMIAVPSIVRVPDSQPAPVSFMAPVETQRVPPEPVVDPVTGRLRDTPGWTGRTDSAAGIGCFPCD